MKQFAIINILSLPELLTVNGISLFEHKSSFLTIVRISFDKLSNDLYSQSELCHIHYSFQLLGEITYSLLQLRILIQ